MTALVNTEAQTPWQAAASRLPAVGWCADARVDPITGLVAFPDFHAAFPELLAQAVFNGTSVGLAIGDVDNLKEYVEGTNRNEPGSFGHLAGYAVMSRLGEAAQAWFWDQAIRQGCVSTFGGDEIIVALAVADGARFAAMVAELRDRLNQALPRTVSFAITVIDPEASRHRGRSAGLYLHAMTTLDRHLFGRKKARRDAAETTSSFITVADLVGGVGPVTVPS